jgi:hypothetical protein
LVRPATQRTGEGQLTLMIRGIDSRSYDMAVRGVYTSDIAIFKERKEEVEQNSTCMRQKY